MNSNNLHPVLSTEVYTKLENYLAYDDVIVIIMKKLKKYRAAK